MTSKSPFKKLLDAWTKKPFWELRDIEKPRWGGSSDNQLTLQNPTIDRVLNETPYRGIDFEPIFNRSGSSLKGVLYRPLFNIEHTELLRHCMEAIDAIHYWQCSNRIIPLILPIQSRHLIQQHHQDGLCDLVLNSRLPIGLINIGLIHPEESSTELINAITKLRRLGVLFHALHFDGNPKTIKLISQFQFEAVHIDAQLIREPEYLSNTQLIDQINLFKKWSCKTYLSNVTFVRDNELSYELGIDYCYGSLMLSPVNRHQVIHIQNSRIGKALFSIQNSKKLNHKGDSQ